MLYFFEDSFFVNYNIEDYMIYTCIYGRALINHFHIIIEDVFVCHRLLLTLLLQSTVIKILEIIIIIIIL